MKLHGTPPSHFTRKVRILLQELGQPYQFIVLKGLMETGAGNFAGNPLHQFPVLVDGDRRLWESNLICEYLLDRYGSNQKRVAFLPQAGDRHEHRQRLAIMDGAMAAGVKLIRAKRSEIPDYMSFPFFRQEAASLLESLDWLERDLAGRTRYCDDRLSMLDVTLLCFAEWAVFREVAVLPPGIDAFVRANCDRPSFAATHPALENPAQ